MILITVTCTFFATRISYNIIIINYDARLILYNNNNILKKSKT